MSAHTEGLLTLGKYGVILGGPGRELKKGIAFDQIFMACVTESGDQQENARRLVACWNALDGLPTELLEKHGATRSGIYRGTAEMAEKLAAARALLAELIDIEGQQPGTAAWSDKVRTFLKVKP